MSEMAAMYVIVDSGTDDEVLHSDVAAVCVETSGWIRLCREGDEDEYIESGRRVTVTGGF